jgi:very-short-patch-repair endonuclease
MKNKTTEQFILEAKAKHDDKYDYSKVIYTKKDNKIIITCKIHGDFEQCANSHLQGKGCKKCGIEKAILSQKNDITIFLEKAKKKHCDLYDYSKVEYINCKTKVIIICKEHGEFLQTPKDHYNSGCKKCADILRGENRKYTKEEIIQKAKEIHENKYDYSNVLYSDGIIENIKCNIHGYFSQLRYIHINCKGECKKCADILRGENRKYTKEEIIQKAKEIHKNKYDYSKVVYNGIYDKIIIICKEHGEFLQTPSGHIRGTGCQKCYDERRSSESRFTKEEIIQKAIKVHGDKYDYSKVVYTNIDTKIIIICKIHGEFQQSSYCHINNKNGCPFCINKTEGKLYETLVPLYPTIITQFKQEWCKKKRNLPFDFCILEHKIIIELDGPQHFKKVSNWSTPEEQFKNDKYKEKCANDNGYSVIRLLQEDVFYETYDWRKELYETIEKLKNDGNIVNIYLCKNNKYDIF